MMLAFWIVVIGVCVLLAGYYAGTETGFYRLNRVRLRLRLAAGDPKAERLDAVLRPGDEFVITTLVGNNLFVFLATLLCTQLYEPLYHQRAELAATATLVVPIFMFGEVLQKEVFRRSADVLMYRATTMLSWSRRLFHPVVFLLKQLRRFWKIFIKEDTQGNELRVGRHRLHHFFSESALEGTLSDYQSAMAANVMRLQHLPVERVMVPLQATITMSADQTLESCRELMRTGRYRRFPVADADDRIIGFVNVLDVLTHADGPFDLRRYLREPTVLDREANVIDALHVLKHSRQPMGFVRDAAGEVIGIVTIKDLVEEIVGELGDW